MKIIPFLILLLCVAGCAPQKSLAKRLKDADRVVVTNKQDALSILVTGAELDKLVQAISGGKKESPTVSCSPSIHIQFFKGSQQLVTLPACTQVFWIDHQPFSDATGTLEALYRRYREEHPVKF